MNLRIQILKASVKNEKGADPDYDELERGKTNRSVLFFRIWRFRTEMFDRCLGKIKRSSDYEYYEEVAAKCLLCKIEYHGFSFIWARVASVIAQTTGIDQVNMAVVGHFGTVISLS